MKINQIVIGVKFTEKHFRLTSLDGLVVDEIFSMSKKNKKIDKNYFTKVGSNESRRNFSINLKNDEGTNSLTIDYDQVILRRMVPEGKESISLNSVVEEFEPLWKSIDSVLNFGDIRRIGLVAEHILDAKNKKSCTPYLVEKITRFKKMQHGANFKLSFDERSIPEDNKIKDLETIDYINVIKSIYDSSVSSMSLDEGTYCFDIDVQRYFNPACKNPVKEISGMRAIFNRERTAFIKFLNDLGVGD